MLLFPFFSAFNHATSAELPGVTADQSPDKSLYPGRQAAEYVQKAASLILKG